MSTRSGSSPLARGLRAGLLLPLTPAGIIPARAGFTVYRSARARRTTDHPRSRGVYVDLALYRDHYDGSSPLARGLQSIRRTNDAIVGIIPARAGFTNASSRTTSSRSDHPRSRGVYNMKAANPNETFGSSPLARGLRADFPVGGGPDGIIPARAGFTWYQPPGRFSAPDHPRSRGVYSCESPGFSVIPGSSPLARGLRDL